MKKQKKKRKICVVTGTRAEYGILYPVMKAINKSSDLDLIIVVTGMHLIHKLGYTVREVEKDGFKIDAKVKMFTEKENDSISVAKALGKGIIGMIKAFKRIKPNIVLLFGDRGEVLAAALAAAHMEIPIAHIHGGDSTSSGMIDEPSRHSITKFAHIHFPATKESAQRIIKMGEEPWRIHIVGPLGLISNLSKRLLSPEKIAKKFNLDLTKPFILVLQHPITFQVGQAAKQMQETMEAIAKLKQQTVVIYPNGDPGTKSMIKVIEKYRNLPFIKVYPTLPYEEFLSLMKVANIMIGNSSSGIIEAPFFNLPVANIGDRNADREQANNVFLVPHKRNKIIKAIKKALTDRKFKERIKKGKNPYNVEEKGYLKIANILKKIKISPRLLKKRMTY